MYTKDNGFDKQAYAERKRGEIRKQMDHTLDQMMNCENIAEFITQKTLYKLPDTVPAVSWSYLNQMQLFIHNTMDARGFRQWQKAGRNVKKGSKSFKILVPCFKKETDEQTQEDILRLCYFKPVPVFALDDTEGDDPDYFPKLREIRESEQNRIENLSLFSVARSMGIPVRFELTTGHYTGFYSAGQNSRSMVLCTDDESVFFHELAHAVDHQLNGDRYKNFSKTEKEVLAEFVACFLARTLGKSHSLKNSLNYIKHFSNGCHPLEAVGKIMERAVSVVLFILDTDRKQS